MRFLATAALALLLATPAASGAVSPTFPLKIKVTDASTAVFPNAIVSIAPISEPVSKAQKCIVLKTVRDGTATANLKPETYAVSVSAPGFKSFHQQIKMNKPISLAVKLEVAGTVDPISIESPAPSIQTTTLPLRELIPESH